MSSLTNFLLNRAPANKTPPNSSDADMAEVEAGQNSHALVVYNSNKSKAPNNDVAVTSANLRTPQKHVPDKPEEPFTPSKRHYREVDNSVTLREQNRAMISINENLLKQQLILTQQAETATQQAIGAQKQRENDYNEMSRRVEEATQQAAQAQKQHEQDSEAMQVTQRKFQQGMMNRFEADLAKFKVCLFPHPKCV
jgi:hypothetical protein